MGINYHEIWEFKDFSPGVICSCGNQLNFSGDVVENTYCHGCGLTWVQVELVPGFLATEDDKAVGDYVIYWF